MTAALSGPKASSSRGYKSANWRSEEEQQPPGLRRTMGWMSLAVMGVSYVISGDFAGWNSGLESGLAAFLIAFGIVSLFYLSLGLCMSELSAALPAAGGGYTFARCALGDLGGLLTGTTVLLEYTLTAAAIGTFITVYINELVGREYPLWCLLLALYLLCGCIHAYGVGEAVKVLLAITGLAVVGLLAFFVGAGMGIDRSNLALSHQKPTITAVWKAIPYCMWFFLAIEGVPLAAEEAVDPQKNVPRGFAATWSCLFVFGALTTLITVGKIGAEQTAISSSPLIDALVTSTGQPTAISRCVNGIGLFGLLASFFAIIYAYSRLTFALARARFLPPCLAKLNRYRAPWLSICAPSLVAYLTTLGVVATNKWKPSLAGNLLLQAAVSAASLSYVLILVSYVTLKLSQQQLNRPYRVAVFVPPLAVASGLLVFSSVLIGATWRDMLAIGASLAVTAAYYLLHGFKNIEDDTEVDQKSEVCSTSSTARSSTRFDSPDYS